jgi:hypothetical protein
MPGLNLIRFHTACFLDIMQEIQVYLMKFKVQLGSGASVVAMTETLLDTNINNYFSNSNCRFVPVTSGVYT